MKILKYGFVIILLSAFVFGCKKDHSSKTFNKLPEFRVDTVGGLGRFEIAQGTELMIDPKIIFNGDQSDLSYLWRFSPPVTGDPNRSNIRPDTTKTKVFKSIINNTPGTYQVELQVMQMSTGLRAFMRYTIFIPNPVPYGYLLAHEVEGNTAIGFVRIPQLVKNLAQDDIRTDIYTNANGSPIPGKPLVFFNSTTVVTDKTAVRVNVSDYKKTFNFENLFVSPPVPKPEGYTGQFFVNNGEAYWYYSNSGTFIGKVLLNDPLNLGYKASPRLVDVDGEFGEHGGFFDELNKRFVRLKEYLNLEALPYAAPGTPVSPAPRFTLYNMNKNLVSDLVQGITGNINRYGLFREFDNSKTWLYGVNFNTPDKPDGAVYELSAVAGLGSDMNNVKFFELGTLSSMAIAATDNTVYSFTYGTSIQDVNTGFTAPAGEVITSMKIFKANGSGFTGDEVLNNKVLMVATYNAATKMGKLYMLTLNPVNGKIGTAIRVISGFGKINGMMLKTS